MNANVEGAIAHDFGASHYERLMVWERFSDTYSMKIAHAFFTRCGILLLVIATTVGCLKEEEVSRCDSQPSAVAKLCADSNVWPLSPTCAQDGIPREIDFDSDGVADLELAVTPDTHGVGSAHLLATGGIAPVSGDWESIESANGLTGVASVPHWTGGSCILIQSGPCSTGYGSYSITDGMIHVVQTSNGRFAKFEKLDSGPGSTAVIGAGFPDNYHSRNGLGIRWSLSDAEGRFCK